MNISLEIIVDHPDGLNKVEWLAVCQLVVFPDKMKYISTRPTSKALVSIPIQMERWISIVVKGTNGRGS